MTASFSSKEFTRRRAIARAVAALWTDPAHRAKRLATRRSRARFVTKPCATCTSPVTRAWKHRERRVFVCSRPCQNAYIATLKLRLGKKMPSWFAKQMSARLKGKKQTPEWIAKRAEALGDGRLKAGWTSERRYAQAVRCARQPRRSSALECAVAEVLDLLGEPYEAQKRIGRYAVDFYLSDRKLIVECDGEFWHKDKIRDDLRDANLREAGYHHIVHIPGKAIQKDAREALEASWNVHKETIT